MLFPCSLGALVVMAAAYPNVTLRGKSLQATVFTPGGKHAYYTSSRFDWGTMVGDIKLGNHVLFPSDFWSQPHDPRTTDAGVGVASEFGCGETGSTCGGYYPGWGAYSTTATNGVLGFDEAAVGEPFLKIGVGKLVKDNANYSPFEIQKHSEAPVWSVNHTHTSLTMTHAAKLNSKWGYRIQRTFKVTGLVLSYETVLENTGTKDFTTTHYSHSFLSLDHQEVGPGWEVTLDTPLTDYREPGGWAVPLTDHWKVSSSSRTLRTKNKMGIDKSKAMFASKHHSSKGMYTATFDKTISVKNEMSGPLPLFSFNLYIEGTTLSPEPMQMISVPSGHKVKFGHTLTFSDASTIVV